MSELPAGTAGAATTLITGTCRVAGNALAGAGRVAGQPSRPRLPSPATDTVATQQVAHRRTRTVIRAP